LGMREGILARRKGPTREIKRGRKNFRVMGMGFSFKGRGEVGKQKEGRRELELSN